MLMMMLLFGKQQFLLLIDTNASQLSLRSVTNPAYDRTRPSVMIRLIRSLTRNNLEGRTGSGPGRRLRVDLRLGPQAAAARAAVALQTRYNNAVPSKRDSDSSGYQCRGRPRPVLSAWPTRSPSPATIRLPLPFKLA